MEDFYKEDLANQFSLLRRVTTQESLDRVNKSARSRRILPHHLTNDPPMRQYIVVIDNQMVGRAGG